MVHTNGGTLYHMAVLPVLQLYVAHTVRGAREGGRERERERDRDERRERKLQHVLYM